MSNRKMKSWMLGWVLSLGALSAHAELVVIVNPSNSVNLTQEQIAALYLGNATSFPDGSSAVLTDQPESAGVRNDFYQKATGRSAAQAKATWARITFSGKGTPPKELKSDADVKAFVAGNPKAIGYIDSSAVDGSVKVVLKL
jgi:ABC-type phosphate transport system substrate-binding protein